jgi:alkylation response protein AidB-like acyl-CoA dehydrogenase
VISFKMTEEQEMVREAMRGFADEVLRPVARDCDEESKLSEEALSQCWELSLVSTQLPAKFGGGDEPHSAVTNALVLEELAWGDAAQAVAVFAPAGFAFAVLDQGTEDQKARYLPLFCNDAYHAASLAVCEPGPTFDVMLPRTVAEPKGDAFVLSGAKCFVPMSDRASHFLVVARCNGDLGAFIVPREAEGLRVSEPQKNLGLRALPTATLDLQRVVVPAADRLGGQAGCDVGRLVAASRTGLGAVLVGLSRAVLEYAVPYAKDRVAFDQAIAQKQGIAFKLSDMHIETEASRWLTWKAASQLERGLDATRAAHFVRSYVPDQAMWIADQGVQVLGGPGDVDRRPGRPGPRRARLHTR